MKLNGSINNTQTTISVSELDSSVGPDILVDYEIMTIVLVNGSGFNVIRGSRGTKAASHSNQVTIYDSKKYPTHNEPLGLLSSMGKKVIIGDNLELDETNVLSGTGSGTVTFDSQTQNTILAAPDDADGEPTFRILATSDLPTQSLHIDSHYGTITTDTDGATITFNMATSDKHLVILGGSRTLAVSNTNIGQTFSILLQQDGTGSRTVTWFSGIRWVDGTVPTLTTAANKIDVFIFMKIASNSYIGFISGQNI